MARYIITQSLLSAWEYVFSCREEKVDEAMDAFLQTLDRVKTPPTEDMQNGIDFERFCYAMAQDQIGPICPDNWRTGAEMVAGFLKGAQIQVRIQRPITVAGMDFLVVGVLDALRAGTIYDVKFKNKSFNSEKVYLAGSYLSSPQHPIYFFLVPEALEFQYLVSDGNDLYIERYTPDETTKAEELILQFIQFLAANKLMDRYKEHWEAK